MNLFLLDKLLLAKFLSLGAIEGIPVGGISIISILGIGYSKYLDVKNKSKKRVKR